MGRLCSEKNAQSAYYDGAVNILRETQYIIVSIRVHTQTARRELCYTKFLYEDLSENKT